MRVHLLTAKQIISKNLRPDEYFVDYPAPLTILRTELSFLSYINIYKTSLA